MTGSRQRTHFRFWLWLIQLIGVIVPRRLRADWRQEWEAELRYREIQLATWEHLDWRAKADLLRRSLGAFWDALLLQPQRLEDDMFQDLRFGVRMLGKTPGLTLVLVLTLALGIGANAALFSIVNGVLLNPLPYPQPEQLVTLHQSKPNFDAGAIPYPNFQDWQKENQTFASMAISRSAGFTLLGAGETERVSGRWVSAEYFSVLGISPTLGRNFASGEDAPSSSPVVIISDGFRQRKFGATPDVLGQSLTLDDKSYAIIGVLPESAPLNRTTDVYVPIGQWNTPALKNRSAGLALHGIGRLKDGVTLAQARADMNSVMQHLAAVYPNANQNNGATLIPLRESIVGNISLVLWLLLGAVGFVLLIACVNVSNLLLARSIGRTREFTIRAALGASQGRLLRQSLTESILLSFIGGGLGLLVAALATRAALSALPTVLPRADEIRVDARVLLFTFAVSLFTGILAGLAPALKASHWRLAETLKQGGRGVSGGRGRMQGVLVAVEMALALVLLVGAGLMIRSLSALWNVDPGFRAAGVLTFSISLPPSMRSAKPEAIDASWRELNANLNAMPNVRAASFSTGAIPILGEDDRFFWIEGEPKPASTSEMHMALIYEVEPTYLPAMDIPLKQGRFFTRQDDEQAPNVVVIDEVLARQYFPQDDPIGKHIYMGDDFQAEIVGVVGHVMQWGLDGDNRESLQAQMYQPFKQASSGATGVSVIMRVEGAAMKTGTALFDSVRQVVQSQHSQNVIFQPQTMNEIIAKSLAAQRFVMILLNAFAVVALLLASIGLYGVISYLVGQRTHELGIRLALGAERRDILQLILRNGMKMALGGVGLGLIGALCLTRLLAEMLYGVSATDPATFAIIASLLTAVALLASYLPARRATRVDPLVALRHE